MSKRTAEFRETGKPGILLGEDHITRRDRPVDTDVGIVPYDPCFAVGGIIIIHLIDDLGKRGKGAKGMCKAARDEQLLAAVGGQGYAAPAPEARRAAADVDGNIKDRPPYDANELGLRMRWPLEMQTPYRPSLQRHRLIVLHKFAIDADFDKIPSTEGL